MKEGGSRDEIAVIFGVPFHAVTALDVLERALWALDIGAHKTNKASYFMGADVNLVSKVLLDDELKEVALHADRLYCTSYYLVKLAQFFQYSLEYIRDDEWIPELLRQCVRLGHSVYLLGETDGELRHEVVPELRSRYPGIRVAGYGVIPDVDVFKWNHEVVLEGIRKASPALLITSFGSVNEQRWVYSQRHQLKVPLVVGGGPRFCSILGKRVVGGFFRNFFRYVGLTRHLLKERALFNDMERSLGVQQRHIVESHAEYDILRWVGSVSVREKNIPMPISYHRNIICDSSAVSFIDSAGLGKMVLIAKQCAENGKLFGLLKPSEVILKALQVTRLDKQVLLLWSMDEIEDAIKQHQESLVLFKTAANGVDFIIKPFGGLKAKIFEKIEKEIVRIRYTFTPATNIILSLEHVQVLDSRGIGAILSLKKQLELIQLPLFLGNVRGLPLKTIEFLHLNQLLVEAASLEDVS